jgi:sugar lactone lactonase YvrE
MTTDRYGESALSPRLARGWHARTLIEGTRLVGANGLRMGSDNHLYVAQAFGGQISAVNLDGGDSKIVSPADGAIVAPDDLAFDSRGNLFVTEVMSARVSALRPNGDVQVIAEHVPVANGIVVHNDRIFMSEFNPEGRILELYPEGAPPRVIASNLMMPNALSVGPDDYLYFPLVPLGEVWRVAISGGNSEKVAAGFDIPTAVKFSPGGLLTVVESGTGAVIGLDVKTGEKTKIGQVAYGIDNLAYTDDGRLFVSHFTDGSITEIKGASENQAVVNGGMLGPFGLATGSDGNLVIADGMSMATLTEGGLLRRPAMLLQHGFPGYVRGVAVDRQGNGVFTNSAGAIARYSPGGEAEILAADFDRLMGICVANDGNIYAAESGAGAIVELKPDGSARRIAGLNIPCGLCSDDNGNIYVSDEGDGTVKRLRPNEGTLEVLAKGLSRPQGIAFAGFSLYVLDRGSHSLVEISCSSGDHTSIADNLPVGMSGSLRANTLPGIADLMPGPLLPFSDLTVLPSGGICVGGDENGSVLVIYKA